VALLIFLAIMITYTLLIYFIMAYSRYFFETIYFDYPWLHQCDNINRMFAHEAQANNGFAPSYLKWAKVDQNYIEKGQSTGFYQCYCTQQISKTNFWQAWSNPNLEICQQYVLSGFGGHLVTLPCGILNAIMVNVGALLVIKLAPMIKFHSRHIQQHVTTMFVFFFTYLSLGILVLTRYNVKFGAERLPGDFTTPWLIFYSRIISTQMIVSNLLPYAGPLIKYYKRMCCCCCKRKLRLDKHKNPEFNLERRYGTVLATIFTCFTYGFMMPTLFVIATFVFLTQFILDKLFITYFYKEKVMHNDFLNRSVLRALKYAIVLFLYFGGSAMRQNYCSITNQTRYLNFSTELLTCRSLWSEVIMCYCLSIIIAAFFLMSEVNLSRVCYSETPLKKAFFEKLLRGKDEYF
jgi:hypothetical protein